MADAPAPAPVAPPPQAAPPPASHEVPINPNPVDTPAPLSSTGPARREVIGRAVERANDQAKLERKGPAEARMGHNQPPEATEREKPPKAAEPSLNLKKRPTDQQPQQQQLSQPSQARERGEGGRFTPRQDQRAGVAAPPSLPANAPYRDPPQRMSERARSEWAAAPASVRGEVHRMHREFSEAYHRLKADHDVFNTVRPYHDLARSQGTTLQQAMTNYVGIEKKLREDPIAGLDTIVNNLNLRTSDGRRLNLADVAYHVLSQSPEQHQLTQSQNQQQALAQQLAEIRRQQHLLAQQQQRMQYDQQFRQTRGTVNRFADTHPRLDELSNAIHQELSFGFDLPTAYRRAEMLYPANGQTPAAQTRTPAAQTRTNSNRSISGAPDAGASAGAISGASMRPKARTDRRGSIINAVRRANGSL
jgi:hypothetical protein